jgi:hypothetical protein
MNIYYVLESAIYAITTIGVYIFTKGKSLTNRVYIVALAEDYRIFVIMLVTYAHFLDATAIAEAGIFCTALTAV